jgi:UDP-glucose 4-epimerase
MHVNPEFRNVVVFGGSGFLGSHVADSLSDAGVNVTIFDMRESSYRRDGQQMIIGSINDEEAVEKAVRGADAIFQFAAVADIDEAMERPLDTVSVNILGTVKLLEAAVKFRVKRFVFASTIYVYGKSGGFYRVSKQASEEYIESYKKYHNLDYNILRFGTLYGPRSNRKNSIYRYLYEAISKRSITYAGDGSEMREYIHVKDAANLTVRALDEEYCNKPITLVGHHPWKVGDLFELIKEMLGGDIDIKYHGSRKSDTHYKRTPHVYLPTVARKLVADFHIDMGEGLLRQIHEITESENLHPESSS